MRFLIDSPISEENFVRLVDFIDPSENQTVLDIGCGKGTLLQYLHDRFRCSGVGVDVSQEQIDIARDRMGNTKAVEFILADITDFKTDRRFDIVSCFGTWRGFPGLDYTRQFLKPAGMVLFGTNYWRKEPDEPYEKHFRIDESEKGFMTIDSMVEDFYNRGYEVLYMYTDTKQESDYYQSLIWRKRQYSDNQANRHSKLNYVRWIREYHGWSVWLLREMAK